MSLSETGIRIYYERGLWTEGRVRDAVEKGVISEAAYEAITGKKYKK